ncbi:MAG: hypothetical protein HC815_17010 [Richelia sp. RM1_1_1]|nr:hypothetical protein [Richelia sp. RM1_1_1]
MYEIVAVFWILASLFCLAQWQGYTDARLDAINETSLRPIVTLISPSDKSALGRNLHDLIINNQSFNNPPLKEYHIIGEAEQFRMIWGRETNDRGNPERPVWRLLNENSDWVYIFPALPSKFKNSIAPPILAISKKDGQAQLLILRNP